ncbi:unannotated protein [freshwater metagenome]|uniref:Unannotated protein n=1 Tax=freshwater metagenome TaxID=449393 RepID=A0A6J7TV37_9ZZZZ
MGAYRVHPFPARPPTSNQIVESKFLNKSRADIQYLNIRYHLMKLWLDDFLWKPMR